MSGTSRRRWIGGLALFSAACMLAAGETVLKNRLSPVLFLVYWLVCMAFTGVAIAVALADLRVQSRTAKNAQRELLDSALREIQASAQARHGQRSPPASQPPLAGAPNVHEPRRL